MQPQPQIQFVNNTVSDPNGPRPKFAKDSQKACGIIQIALGVFCVCLAIASIAIRAGLYFVGTGFWCGIFMIIAGVLGVVSSKNENTGAIVGCMIMSIFSCLLATVVLSMASAACVIDQMHAYYGGGRSSYSYSSSPTTISGAVAVDALGVLVGLTEFFVAIVQSAVCCRTTCCGPRSNATTVVYFQQPYPGYQQNNAGMIMTPAVGGSGMGQVPAYHQPQQQPYDPNTPKLAVG